MKYIVVFESKQKGKLLYTEAKVIESSRIPRIGEGTRKLCDPPIETVVAEVYGLPLGMENLVSLKNRNLIKGLEDNDSGGFKLILGKVMACD